MPYNSNDMEKMQQDAVKRIQEMQSRNRHPSQIPVPVEHTAESPSKNNTVISDEEHTTNNFFEMLFGDKEKSLLLVLILLISSEKKGDISLLFALIYLLI